MYFRDQVFVCSKAVMGSYYDLLNNKSGTKHLFDLE